MEIKRNTTINISTSASTSIVDVFLAFLFALYPVLPSYTLVFGLRLHSLLSFVSFFVFLAIAISRNYSFSKRFSLLLLFVLSLLTISSLVNHDFLTTSFVSLVAQFVFVSVFLFYVLSEKRNKKVFFKTSIIIGVITCLLSITELFGFNVFSLICNKENPGAMGPVTGQRFGIYRIESSFGQAIAYSIYLTYILILMYYYILKYKKRDNNGNLVFVAAIFFINIFIFLTLSRFPILIAVFVNLIGFITLNKRNKLYYIIIVILFLWLLLISLLAFDNSLLISLTNNIISVFRGDSAGDYNPFVYRLGLYTYVDQILNNIKEWLFGVGLSGEYSFYVPTGYGGYVRKVSIDNGFLYILVTQGIVGLIAWFIYYAFFLTLFIIILRSRNKNVDKESGFFGLLIVLVTLLNMLSVARLDESRAFCVFIPLLLSCGLNNTNVREYDCVVSFCNNNKRLDIESR